MSVHGREFDRGLDAHLSPPDFVECSRCEGSGEAHANPSPINDPQCVIDGTCPRCHGSGAEPEPDEVEFDGPSDAERFLAATPSAPVFAEDFGGLDGAAEDRPF